ncbi:MAG: hypothetical protein EXS05_01920 [Planctomycetaceae bacterium]|nr:hypothetical protein [Planctomycetaceae bacterium]
MPIMTNDDLGRSLDSPEVPSANPPNAPAPAPATRKPRSPVERAIVWGVILLLLIVVLIEWRGSSGIKSDADAAHAAMEKSTKGYLTESELNQLVTRYSHRESQTGLTANEIAASRVDTFTYSGLLKKRMLYIYFGLPRAGHEQEVLQVGESPVRMYTPEDFGMIRQDDSERKESESSKESTEPEATTEREGPAQPEGQAEPKEQADE